MKLQGERMGQNSVTATDSTFADLIEKDVPSLVDFWAEWCGPCKMMDGPLEELAGANSGKLSVLKLNVDDNQSTAMQYGVMSIPTMIIFQGGQERKRMVGARSKAQLEAEIAEFLT
jgi:thioredoxin 1